MAPHVTKVEQDPILAMARRNKTTSDIFGTLEQRRRRQNVPMVNITVLRRFPRGKTHRLAAVERRGRKRVLSRSNVQAMEAVRRKFVPRD